MTDRLCCLPASSYKKKTKKTKIPRCSSAQTHRRGRPGFVRARRVGCGLLLWPLRKPAGQVTSPPDPLLCWDSSSCSSSLLQWLTGKAWLSSHRTAGGKRDTSPEAQIVMSTRYSKLWSIRRAGGNQMPLEMTKDRGGGGERCLDREAGYW